MNIKTKLILGIGMLAGMIILLVTLSVVNLQILTATEPDSPAATPGLERALLWISVTGGICILTGLILLYWLPRTIMYGHIQNNSGFSWQLAHQLRYL